MGIVINSSYYVIARCTAFNSIYSMGSRLEVPLDWFKVKWLVDLDWAISILWLYYIVWGWDDQQ